MLGRHVGKLLWLAPMCALALLPAAASAKAYEVTRRDDPNPGQCKRQNCSLREAVLAANASLGEADRIVLPNREKPYRLTQLNPGGTGDDSSLNGDLDVSNDPLRIVHPGKGKATIDANGIDRHVEAFANLSIKGLRLVGGANPSSGVGDGGAIRADGFGITVTHSAIVGNRVGLLGFGGAIDMDGAGHLTIRASLIARNSRSAVYTGTGFTKIAGSRFSKNRNSSDGGAIHADSTSGPIAIERSTFSRNQSNETTSGGGGAIYTNGETVLIRESTFDRNRSKHSGGAIFNSNSAPEAVNILNSTFAENRAAAQGGAIASPNGSEIFLNATTIARNVSGEEGGGVYFQGADVRAYNVLLGFNQGNPGSGEVRNDCSGGPATLASSNLLVSTRGPSGSCALGVAAADIVKANPKIAELKGNGGPTKTIALRKGSAAINAADDIFSPDRDQRGRKRRNPDIGAYERR